MADEIAIAGCGPAGLAAALALSAQGRAVRLFDQFETPEPIGSGLLLQPVGLQALDEIHAGAAQTIRALGQPIRRLEGRAADTQRLVLDVAYEPKRGAEGRTALAIHRAALFDGLLRAVQAVGLPLETGARLIGVDRDGGGRPILIAKNGRRFGPFELLVDASGARSALRDDLGANPGVRPLPFGALWATTPWTPAIAEAFAGDALEQRYRRADKMAGVLPVGCAPGADGAPGEPLATYFWSLKPAEYEAWRAAGLDAWREEAAAFWPETTPLLETIRAPEQLTLARYAHFTLARPYAERVVWIGDSAHATSPQLGQGANMALLDALALARALAAEARIAQALPLYARTRRWHVRFYQFASRLFTPVYQSDSRLLPWLRDRFMAPAAQLPGAAGLLARLISGDLIDPFRAMPDGAAPFTERAAAGAAGEQS